MARMSIDDKVGRDPRITLLAVALGWSKRELVGCLVLDVWPLCYDQESPLVSERIIDAAAGRPGFGAEMVEAELATRDRSGKLRITGAAKRIAYLDHQKKAGRQGGLKSAEMRDKESKGRARVREAEVNQPSRVGQGSGNPSASVPDSASASASAPDKPTAPELSLSPPAAATDSAEGPEAPVVRPQPARAVRPLPPAEAMVAARRLLDLIAANTPASTLARLSERAKDDRAGKWADAFRLLHERDGHAWSDITAMVEWVQADPFWRQNILSGDKLREKWDQLAAKRAAETKGAGSRYGRVAEANLITNDDIDAEEAWLREHAPGMVAR